MKWCKAEKVSPAGATQEHVKAYRRHLIETGYTRDTIALKLGVVRRLYDAAQWRGLRMDNPAATVKPPKDKTAQHERVKYLPLDGLKRLLAAPHGDGAKARRDRAILALMGMHGLRVAEVATLRLADLDLDAGRVVVIGKGSKRRTVDLIPSTVATLTDWLEVRDARPEVGTVFVVVGPRGTGTPISTRAIRAMVDGYLDALGLKAAGISCHALRHSAATWARAAGAKLDAIGDMLGHASTDTTRVYARIVDRMAENPARYLADLLGA